LGTIKFAPWKRIWKSWAPLKCNFFCFVGHQSSVLDG
jgi:hypothetical protein